MLLFRWIVMLLLLGSVLSFAMYAATGQMRWRNIGIAILKWTVAAALAFFAVLKAGALAEVATLLGKLGANIDEVHHQRAFSTLSVQSVEVELVLQTRNPAHVQEVVAALVAIAIGLALGIGGAAPGLKAR